MTAYPVKIVDKLRTKNSVKFSFEVTPNVSIEELEEIQVDLSFVSITWHANLHQCKGLDISPLQLARHLRSKGIVVLVHLSCDRLKKGYLDDLLKEFKEQGICNIFTVLGENYEIATSDYPTTADLIKYIRNKTGNYFCIGVAGYPNGTETSMKSLQEKISAGADFVISQAFVYVNTFESFVATCKANGINQPIIPGIFIYKDEKQLVKFIELCNVKVPDEQLLRVKESYLSSDDLVTLLIQLTESLGETVANYHLFTMNQISLASQVVQMFLGKYEKR